MPERKGQIVKAVGVRTAGVKRGKAKTRTATQTSLRPKTQVAVAEGFNNILTANDNAIKITYTR